MSVEAVRDILVAASAVTALVSDRISPNVRAQDEAVPAVTLEVSSINPFHCISEPPTLDFETIIVNCWADTYDEVVELAAACRDALEAADLNLKGQSERYEPTVGEYLMAMEFSTFT